MLLMSRWYNSCVPEVSWQQALDRTRRAAFGRVATLLGSSELTAEFWDELEAALVQADVGINTTITLLDQIREQSRQAGWIHHAPVRAALRNALASCFPAETTPEPAHSGTPWLALLLGVNGSGKTTTAAKLAYRWKQAGNHVMLAAADTYRAAAQEQLAVWADRLQLDLITGTPGSDPGAVVYDAAQAATARGANVLVVDTSGRMHTEHNLMAELQKIYRVAAKVIPGAPHCSLLVLDGTTGQNGIAQVEAFKATIPIDGVVITKLDTSAKGGIAVAVREQLGLPVFFVGLGENIEDLRVFDPPAYVEGLLPSTDV